MVAGIALGKNDIFVADCDIGKDDGSGISLSLLKRTVGLTAHHRCGRRAVDYISISNNLLVNR
jgi:hypothetical protein